MGLLDPNIDVGQAYAVDPGVLAAVQGSDGTWSVPQDDGASPVSAALQAPPPPDQTMQGTMDGGGQSNVATMMTTPDDALRMAAKAHPWTTALRLMGATLQDMGAGVGGRQGDALTNARQDIYTQAMIPAQAAMMQQVMGTGGAPSGQAPASGAPLSPAGQLLTQQAQQRKMLAFMALRAGHPDQAAAILKPDLQIDRTSNHMFDSTTGQDYGQLGVSMVTGDDGVTYDPHDPANLGVAMPKPPVAGATPLFGPKGVQGGVQGWTLPDGSTQAVQSIAQATSQGTAQGTANVTDPRTLVQIPDPDNPGATKTVTQGWLAAQAGAGNAGPASASAPTGFAQPQLATIKAPNGQQFTVNRAIGLQAAGLLHDLQANGYAVNDVGGYNNRNVSGANVASPHSAGLAIDVNSATNQDHTAGNIPPALARSLAKKWGAAWGGDFTTNRDPMHFSWASSEGGTVPWKASGPAKPNGAVPAVGQAPTNNGVLGGTAGAGDTKFAEAQGTDLSTRIGQLTDAREGAIQMRSNALQAQGFALSHPMNPATPGFVAGANYLRSLPPEVLSAAGVDMTKVNDLATDAAVFNRITNQNILSLGKTLLPSRYTERELNLTKPIAGTLTTPNEAMGYSAAVQASGAQRVQNQADFAASYNGPKTRQAFEAAWAASPQGQRSIFQDPEAWSHVTIHGKPAVVYTPDGKWGAFALGTPQAYKFRVQ